MSYWAYRKRSIEVITQGNVTLLLEDGRLLLDNLSKASLTSSRVISELRAMNVQHLGELRRVYLEATGHFSLIRYRSPHAGLWIMPTPDVTFFPADTRDADVSVLKLRLCAEAQRSSNQVSVLRRN